MGSSLVEVHMRRGFLVAGIVVSLVVLRPWLSRLISGGNGPRESLPGDDLVAATRETTHAVTIEATADEVWPWLVQLGYRRGGWYSHDRLERLIGAGDFAEGGSARRIVPELQSLAIGDTVALSARGGPHVAILDRGRALVLQGRMNLITGASAHPADRSILVWSWAFVLVPGAGTSCRLISRTRARFQPTSLALTSIVLDPIESAMEQKMLRTIANRAHHPTTATSAA